MFNPKDIIDLLAANVRQTRNPFGVTPSRFNTWWREAGAFTRRPGDALLFTGLMYQAIPYINAAARVLERLEGSLGADYLRFGRFLPASLRGMGLSVLASGAEKKKFNGILHSICRVLHKSGVGFFYHPEMDFYSGILLYDLGDEEGFVEHARFVAKNLKLHGVEKIITVDPHTTYALKELYPKYMGVSFEVNPYFTFIPGNGDRPGNGGPPVAVHDPCFYGRYLELSEGPRRVLRSLGQKYVEVRNCGEFTSCCGGPAESVSPALNREILARRAAELKAAEAPVVTFCPICLANLLKAGLPVEDLATVVGRCLADEK
ncbi:MAG: (Fe-S)-binding protein [Deltaproteobacteria bacterium]|nr:MAG: (Fe-S)-binding protein [Deltaproteobacteria bacterium]